MTNEQDEPVMDGSGGASDQDRLNGMLEQVRADLNLRPHEGAERLLRQRLEDDGREPTDAEVSELLRRMGYNG